MRISGYKHAMGFALATVKFRESAWLVEFGFVGGSGGSRHVIVGCMDKK